MSSQDVVSDKKTKDNPVLWPIKDNNHALVAKLGPAFNSRACLFVLQGPRHISKFWLSIQRFIFLLMFFLRPPRGFWPHRPLNGTAPCEVVSDFISSRLGMLRDQYHHTLCLVKISINAFCHSRTKRGVILAAEAHWVPYDYKSKYKRLLINPEPNPLPKLVGRNQCCLWKEESIHVPICKSFLVTEAERFTLGNAQDFINFETQAFIKYLFSCNTRRRRRLTHFW